MTLLGNEGSAGGGQQGAQGGGNAGGQGQGGGQGGGQASWRDSLPDDLKNDSGLSSFTDVAGLAKSYLHARTMVGKKGVVVPGDKATDDEWSRFYKDLGQPEMDKFDVKLPEGKQGNGEFIGKFKDWAHKAGLLPKQAQTLMGKYLEHEEGLLASRKVAQERSYNEGIDGLKKEWGQGYEKEIAKAKLGVREVGGEEFQKYLESSGLGNNPLMIKLMAKVGGMLGEDKLRGEGVGRMGGRTPAEIQKQIDAVRGNPQHPYFDRSHPGHKNAQAEVDDLYRQLYS